MGAAYPAALNENGFTNATEVGAFETGRNVTDRRFLLETFAAFGLSGSEFKPKNTTTRIAGSTRLDIPQDYDAKARKLFMPYVAGYCLTRGDRDLALFSVSASSNSTATIPADAGGQVRYLLYNAAATLRDLGASFDDVVVVWDRVEDLDTNEDAVLLGRESAARACSGVGAGLLAEGLRRPLAESLLEIAPAGDGLGAAADGTPVIVEYLVVASVPRRYSGGGEGEGEGDGEGGEREKRPA